MSPANKRSVRTALQGIVMFAVAAPGIIAASGIPERLPWVAGGLAVASGLARIMALPSVEALLDRFGIGLADDEPSEGAQ
ncbi:hypothetical protein ACFV2U_21340 [Streptomyces sp. NPDC059697]|uniref:hypothetical protein n=1 Tax=Streptomyces sp. NPDC059697 TaxID=3346912 RepID=UPI00368D9F16